MTTSPNHARLFRLTSITMSCAGKSPAIAGESRLRCGDVRRLALVAGAFLIPGCGGSPKLEYARNEPGNFRVLAAGKPELSQQTLPSPAGPLKVTAIESVDGAQIRRLVVYTDFPREMVQSSDSSAVLDGGIRGMSGDDKWTVQSQTPITLDGHPGREVRFAVNARGGSEKGEGKERIFLVGERLYQAIMVGPASKISEEELDHFVKSFELLHQVPVMASIAPVSAGAPGAGTPVVAQQPAPPPQAIPGAAGAPGAGTPAVAQPAAPPGQGMPSAGSAPAASTQVVAQQAARRRARAYRGPWHMQPWRSRPLRRFRRSGLR